MEDIKTTDTATMKSVKAFGATINNCTTIVIPDVRICFKNGALYFNNIKEVSDKTLYDVYLGLERYLKTLPSISKNRNGDILSPKIYG